jgi:DamX protein
MAASELNNRLDYLISYSSQLVFVCGDKIQQQSKVVESFLAHQNEQVDLALLTANELTPLVIYREKLFRQLISQSQTADFNRPLNQLLAPLNNHSGPILISIFKAEKLPNKLVKELWDLVLQSRFANNKQHLNVLLMGISDWAESAKSGLGAKSKEQPIMINSQIDVQHAESDEFSDLEAFIQDKRNKFAQRIEGRHYHAYESKPVYKKWWMATLFGLAFLAIFSGMLGWQYPEKVRASLAYINTQLSTSELLVKPSDIILDPAVKPRKIVGSKIIELTEPVTAKTERPTSQPIAELTAPKSMPIIKKVSVKDVLVTDWNTASAKLEEQKSKILLQSNNMDAPVDIKENQPIESEQPTKTNDLNRQSNIVNDYIVEDNVELAPMPQQTELPLINLEQIQTSGFLTPKADLILALPDENFVIQIAAMTNIGILQDYVRDAQLSQQLWLYKTQRYGGDWYVLLINQNFASIQDARAEIILLADSMLMNSPFVKSIAQVKQEITVSRP